MFRCLHWVAIQHCSVLCWHQQNKNLHSSLATLVYVDVFVSFREEILYAILCCHRQLYFSPDIDSNTVTVILQIRFLRTLFSFMVHALSTVTCCWVRLLLMSSLLACGLWMAPIAPPPPPLHWCPVLSVLTSVARWFTRNAIKTCWFNATISQYRD